MKIYNPPGTKPPEPGVYDTTEPHDPTPTYQRWDGKSWSWCAPDIPSAHTAYANGAFQNPPWRAIDED